MIYLSAQPSEFFFTWQIKVYITNFYNLGIGKDNIHVLLTETDDLEFKTLAKEYSDKACLFFYKDTRELNTSYISTIRPHLIKKHFDRYPQLEQETIFYHDSDIIFREKIDLSLINEKHNWYLSNSSDYIGIEVLKKYGNSIINDLCKIVGIPVSKAYQNIDSFGGAQYILNNVTYTFWEKHERDCEKIFNFINFKKEIYENIFFETTSSLNKIASKDFRHLIAWCADMWSMILNGWYFGHNLIISEELDFCWPHNNIDAWSKCKIFHNAGVTLKDFDRLFCKSNYTEFSPFDDEDLESYNFDYSKCTIHYIEAIKAVETRKSLEGAIILVVLKDDEDFKGFNTFARYIRKYFKDFRLLVLASMIHLEMLSEDHHIDLELFSHNNFSTLVNILVDKTIVLTSPKVYFKTSSFFEEYCRLKNNKDMEFIIPYNNVKLVENQYAKSYFLIKMNLSYVKEEDCKNINSVFPEMLFIKANNSFLNNINKLNTSEKFKIYKWFEAGIFCYGNSIRSVESTCYFIS